jgi:hypothetical protein
MAASRCVGFATAAVFHHGTIHFDIAQSLTCVMVLQSGWHLLAFRNSYSDGSRMFVFVLRPFTTMDQ